MDIKEVRAHAKAKLKTFCRVCPVCDGRACAGEVPGMGGAGSGSSFMSNVSALASRKLNMRTMHNVKDVDTSVELFGQVNDLPVHIAPMTGTTYNLGGAVSEEDFAHFVVAGAAEAGSIGWTGDGADPTMYGSGLKAIDSHSGKGIAIIKPRQQEEIISRIREAEQVGAMAVGVDVDGAGLITMALQNQPVGPKSGAEMKEVIRSTELPFIIKGVMTVDEAELAAECGAAAIVVSNHGGRVLDHTPGTADVLEAIAKSVKGKLTIFVDGGIRSGADVLKMLALGADAVLIGRPMAIAAFGGGEEGIRLHMNKLKNELVQAMLLTGTASVRNVDRSILV